MKIAFISEIAVQQIKKSSLKAITVVLLMALFCLNTLKHSGEVKSFLRQKSDLARLVSYAMLDNRYIDALIIVEDYTLRDSYYLQSMDAVYAKIIGKRTFPSFISLDILLHYPQISRGRAIYEPEASHLVNIDDSVQNRLNNRRIDSALHSPDMKLTKDKLTIRCAPQSHQISLYLISMSASGMNNYICTNPKLDYPGGAGLEINARSLFRNKSVNPLALTDIMYDGERGWQINRRPLRPAEGIWLFSCLASDGRVSELSALHVRDK